MYILTDAKWYGTQISDRWFRDAQEDKGMQNLQVNAEKKKWIDLLVLHASTYMWETYIFRTSIIKQIDQEFLKFKTYLFIAYYFIC